MATGNAGAVLTAGAYSAYATTPGDLVVQGARLTSDVATARKRVGYTGEDKILDETAPFLAFVEKIPGSRKGTEPIGSSTVQHNERDVIPSTVLLAASGSFTTNSATTVLTFTTGTGGMVVAGTVLKSPRTNEMIFVSAKGAIDSATVTRSFTTGDGAAATLTASEELQILGTNFPENSAAPDGISVEPLIVYSTLQTFRTAIRASGRDMNLNVYGKEEWARQEEDAMLFHKSTIEKAFLFNAGTNTTATTTIGTMTQGVIDRITTNVFNFGGTVLDEITLEDYLCALTRYNVDMSGVVTFGGDNAFKTLDSFARDGVRYTERTEFLGVAAKGWQCSFGEMVLKKHAMFGPIGSNIATENGGYIGYLLSVNLKNCSKLTWRGRGLRLEKNVQLPGIDGRKDCWTEDIGLEVWNERTFGLCTGLAKPS